MFFITKNNEESIVLPVFLVLLVFENREQFSKKEPNRYNMFSFQFVLFRKTQRTQKTLGLFGSCFLKTVLENSFLKTQRTPFWYSLKSLLVI